VKTSLAASLINVGAGYCGNGIGIINPMPENICPYCIGIDKDKQVVWCIYKGQHKEVKPMFKIGDKVKLVEIVFVLSFYYLF